MTTMMQTFRNITQRSPNGTADIENEEFTLINDCENDYYKEQIAIIPAGTKIVADFAGDFGMYAMAEVDGVIYRIKINVHELHNIDFGRFDARKL